MVIIFLLRLLLWTVSTLANLVSLAVFKAVAGVVVLAVQAVKVSAGAVDSALEQAGCLFRWFMEHLVELLKDVLLSLASSAFDLAVSAASGSAELTASGVRELAEKANVVMEGLSEIFPEAFEGLTEIVSKMAGDLWSNYKDALEYVIRNV